MRIVKVNTEEIEQQYAYNEDSAVSTYSSLPPFQIKATGIVTEFVIKKYFDETFIKEITLDENDVVTDGVFTYYDGLDLEGDTSLKSKMGSGGQYQYSFKIAGVEYKSNFKFAFKDIIFPRIISFNVDLVPDTGGGNGSITVNAEGGYLPLTYSINNGSTYQSSNVFSGLSGGFYDVKVKDSKGFESASLKVQILAGALGFNATPTNETQPLEGDGTILVNGFGGTPPYTYAIDDTGYQGSNLLTGLIEDTYDVWIKDSLGDTYNENVVVGSDAGNLITAFGDIGGGNTLRTLVAQRIEFTALPNLGETFTLSWDKGVINEVFTWVAAADNSGTQLTQTTDGATILADLLKNTNFNTWFSASTSSTNRVTIEASPFSNVGDGEAKRYDVTPFASGITDIFVTYTNASTIWQVTIDVSGGDGSYEYSQDKGDTWTPFAGSTLPRDNILLNGDYLLVYFRDGSGNNGKMDQDLEAGDLIQGNLLKG